MPPAASLPLSFDPIAVPMPSAAAPSLMAWAPERWPVAPDWQPVLQPFWHSLAGRRLAQHLQQRLAAGATIYPATPLRALELTPLADVRVVVLGQDPYHGPGQAEGLAFSVPPGGKVPPSLRNIFKELVREYGGTAPASASLQGWARQGVLLLNTVLTVEQGAPASHARRGWETLTDHLLAACNADPAPKVFLLWGAHAQAKAPLLDAQRHLVLTANHPSPLSALRPPVPFIGCGHFRAANAWLQKKNQKTIAWLQKPKN